LYFCWALSRAMALQVFLPSGKELEVTTKPGSKAAALREELSALLEAHSASIELTSGSTVLEDHDDVPEGTVYAIVSALPWLDDGSGHIEDLGGGAFSVGGNPKQGSPINALCDVGFSSGQVYFEIEVVAGDGAFVGIGTKQGFGPGYKLKGLFFGGPGNLSNGSGGLRTGFGDGVAQGSIIGITLDLSVPDSVSMDVWQDGKHLGQAFKSCPREQDASVYPVVKAKAAGDSFRICLRQKVRLPAPPDPSPHRAEGKWKLSSFIVSSVDVLAGLGMAGGKGAGKGKGGACIMDVKALSKALAPEPSTFSMTLKLANTMSTSVTVTPIDAGETITLGRVATTLMGVMGPIAELEEKISANLPNILKWSVTSHMTPSRKWNELHLESNDVEMVFVLDDCPPQEPVNDPALMPAAGTGGYAQ